MSAADELSGTAVDTSKLELLVRLEWMLPYLSDSHRASVREAIAEIQRLRHALRPNTTAAQAATANSNRPR